MVCMATTTSRAVFWTIAELEEIGVNAAAELVHQYLFGVDLVDCCCGGCESQVRDAFPPFQSPSVLQQTSNH